MKRVLYGIISLAMAACTNHTLVHHYETLGDEGWSRTDTLHFVIPPAHAPGDYCFRLGIRYTHRFPYEGVWVETDLQLEKPVVHSRDTLFFRMFDAEGMPRGHGLGLMQKDTVVGVYHLREGQSGTLRVRHLMQKEGMPGIQDIGLSVVNETVASGIHSQKDEQ